MTASHSSSEVLTSIRSRTKPALLTRMSSPPKVSIACRTIASACAKSATSAPLTTASPPAASISRDHLVGRRLARPLAGERDAVVVDDDLGAVAGQLERVGAADAAAGAGDDRDAALETDLTEFPSGCSGDVQEDGGLAAAVAGDPWRRRRRRRGRWPGRPTTLPTSAGSAIRPSGMVRLDRGDRARRRRSGRRCARCGTGRRRPR